MIKRRRVRATRLRVSSNHPVKRLNWRWVAVGVGAVLLLFVYLSGPEGTIRMVDLLMERRRLTRDMQTLERENEAIQRMIVRFRQDPAAIEEEAREKLGLVKKGEIIYRFPKKP